MSGWALADEWVGDGGAAGGQRRCPPTRRASTHFPPHNSPRAIHSFLTINPVLLVERTQPARRQPATPADTPGVYGQQGCIDQEAAKRGLGHRRRGLAVVAHLVGPVQRKLGRDQGVAIAGQGDRAHVERAWAESRAGRRRRRRPGGDGGGGGGGGYGCWRRRGGGGSGACPTPALAAPPPYRLALGAGRRGVGCEKIDVAPRPRRRPASGQARAGGGFGGQGGRQAGGAVIVGWGGSGGTGVGRSSAATTTPIPARWPPAAGPPHSGGQDVSVRRRQRQSRRQAPQGGGGWSGGTRGRQAGGRRYGAPHDKRRKCRRQGRVHCCRRGRRNARADIQGATGSTGRAGGRRPSKQGGGRRSPRLALAVGCGIVRGQESWAPAHRAVSRLHPSPTSNGQGGR